MVVSCGLWLEESDDLSNGIECHLVVRGLRCIFALHFTLAGQGCTTRFRPLQRSQNPGDA